VLAAFVFAYWDKSQDANLTPSDLGLVLPAFLVFCIVASGLYLLNDVRDIEADRVHPVKRLRPIASGIVPVPHALAIAGVLLGIGAVGACILSARFALVIAWYAGIQFLYTLWLKKIALVDILVIAAGFVLRAIAGAVVLDVFISPWLLLCTFLLALFLGLCKRRHEKILLQDLGVEHRVALVQYDTQLLDQLIAICSATTIVCYAIYTLWPETEQKFGTRALGFTIPLVMFGIFRYLDLVYRHNKGGRPEQILLTDVPLILDLVLYAAATFLILAFRP